MDAEKPGRRIDPSAADYKSDLKSHSARVGPARIVGVFAGRVRPDARIIDIGAGAGLLGSLLREKGYTDITAIDLSPGPPEMAGRKNSYRELRVTALGERLGYEDNYFDAGISCGVFTIGRAPAFAFDELVRIIRPGGLLIFTVHITAYETAGFKEKFDELEAAGKWTMVEVSHKFRPLPKDEPNVWHRIWTYRIV